MHLLKLILQSVIHPVLAGALMGWYLAHPLGLATSVFGLVAVLRSWVESDRLARFAAASLFATPFYAVALRPLLLTNDGALGGIWLAITLSLTVLHVMYCCGMGYLRDTLGARSIVLSFPVGWLTLEYVRYGAVWLFDGNGLTMVNVGQPLAWWQSVAQVAEVLGGWGLTSLAAIVAAGCYAPFDPSLGSWRFRLGVMICSGLALACASGFGEICMREPSGTAIDPQQRDVILVPQSFTPAAELAVRSQTIDVPRKSDWIIVFPETSTDWFDTGEQPGQASALRLSHELPTSDIVLGVRRSSGTDRRANSVLTLRDGTVVYAVKKQHPVAFVEKPNWASQWLMDDRAKQLVQFYNDHDRVTTDQVREWPPTVLPSVCYDIFFASTFLPYPIDDKTVAVCCMDETQDRSGVMKSLSVLHTRLRAIEMRVPIVRVSNGGSSGIVDANGDWAYGPWIGPAVRTATVVYDRRNSVYARFGDWWPKLNLVVLVVLFGLALTRSTQPTTSLGCDNTRSES